MLRQTHDTVREPTFFSWERQTAQTRYTTLGGQLLTNTRHILDGLSLVILIDNTPLVYVLHIPSDICLLTGTPQMDNAQPISTSKTL